MHFFNLTSPFIHYLLLTLTFLLLINTALTVPSGSLHPLQDEIEGNRITNKTADFSTTDVVAARYEVNKTPPHPSPTSLTLKGTQREEANSTLAN